MPPKDEKEFGFSHREFQELYGVVMGNASAIKTVLKQLDEIHTVVIGGDGDYTNSLVAQSQRTAERVRRIAAEHERIIAALPKMTENSRRLTELEKKQEKTDKKAQIAVDAMKDIRSKAIGIGIAVGLGSGGGVLGLLKLFS